MKKFILILALVFVSLASYGQYIPQEQKYVPLQEVPEYIAAKKKVNSGWIWLASGFVVESVGAVMMAQPPREKMDIGPILDGSGFSMSSMYTEDYTVPYIGTGLVVTGAVGLVVGSIKLISGYIDMHDARISYTVKNGGIVVSF